MPLFVYSCEECGRDAELLVRGGESVACPHCEGAQMTRQLSAPAAPASGGRSLPVSTPMMGGGCGKPACGMGRCMGGE